MLCIFHRIYLQNQLNNELEKIKTNNKFKTKQKQISNKDMGKIKQLKTQSKSYKLHLECNKFYQGYYR